MFSRKKPAKNEKESAPKRKGGDDLAAMFGLQMPDDENDDDLEAELAALEGRPVKKKSSNKKTPMSMAEIEKLAADSSRIGEDDGDDDDDDFDESALLAELAGLSDDDEEEELEAVAASVVSPPRSAPRPAQWPAAEAASPRSPATAVPPAIAATAVASSSSSSSSPVDIVVNRHAMYQAACRLAKEQGDSSKARRYERGLKTLDAMVKKAKAGGNVDVGGLPAELPPSATGGVVTQPSAAPRSTASANVAATAPAAAAPSGPHPSAVAAPVAKPRVPRPAATAAATSTPATPSPAPAAAAAAAAATTNVGDGSSTRRLLEERRLQYLQALRSAANEAEARQLKLTVAKLRIKIKAHDGGQAIDLADLPPPPGTGADRSASAAPAAATTAAAAAAAAEPRPQAPVDSSIKTPTTVMESLVQRHEKYSSAQKQAHEAGDGSKVRRMNRIIKQYADAIKATRAGRGYNYAELPCPPGYPPIPVAGSVSPASSLSAAAVAASGGASPMGSLTPRQPAAVQATSPQQPPQPAVRAPQSSPAAAATSPALVQSVAVGSSSSAGAVTAAGTPATPQAPAAALVEAAAPSASAIPVPASLLDGLQQRQQKYVDAQRSADQAGESGKGRRMGRIVKQYQDAIKAAKLKKAFDFSELPCPPGYPPLPGVVSASASLSPSASAAAVSQSPTSSLGATASLTASPSAAGRQPMAPASSPMASLQSVASAGPSTSPSPGSGGTSRNDAQLAAVKERYAEYKAAALAAKASGRTVEALAYFKSAKGMEPMLTAAESGLPIDMSSLPEPLAPSAAAGVEQKKRSRTEDDTEVFERLAEGLGEQIATCSRNGELYKMAGDVKGASAFELEAASLQADLDMLKNADSYGEAAPRFHYEEREFSIVRSFPEMGDCDCDVLVDQCHSLPLPSGYKEKDLYTYVVVTFPYPHDEEPSEKTKTVKSSVNPAFDASLRFPVERKSRSLARTLKRHPVRLEVMYERGFLKSDQSMGVGSILIGDLETMSEVHASVDLMEGRKACGGKIEARVRLRQPLSGQDIQKTKQKWLVIDDYANLKSKKQIPPPQAAQRVKQPPAASSSSGGGQAMQSVEVLRYEKQRLEKMMAELRSKKQPIPAAVQQRHQAATERAAALEAKLRSGGKPFLRSYLAQLKTGIAEQQARAIQLAQAGDKQAALTPMHYKKLMSNELEKWANSSL